MSIRIVHIVYTHCIHTLYTHYIHIVHTLALRPHTCNTYVTCYVLDTLIYINVVGYIIYYVLYKLIKSNKSYIIYV